MKYEVAKTCMWPPFRIDPNPVGHPDGVKVIDSADLVVGGKQLPGDVVQLFVRRKCLVPLRDTTSPKVAKDEKK